MQMITAPTWRHELDHTDQGCICPAWQIYIMTCSGNRSYRSSVRGVNYWPHRFLACPAPSPPAHPAGLIRSCPVSGKAPVPGKFRGLVPGSLPTLPRGSPGSPEFPGSMPLGTAVSGGLCVQRESDTRRAGRRRKRARQEGGGVTAAVNCLA